MAHMTADGKIHRRGRNWYTKRETDEIYAKGGHVILKLGKPIEGFDESMLPPEWHELIRTAKGPRDKNWRLASELEGKTRRAWLERQAKRNQRV